jgi:SH3-like domain-containing protein
LAPIAWAATPMIGVLNENSNIRASAGSTKIAVLLPKKTKVAIIGETDTWYHVDLGGSTGWVMKWLVSTTSQAASASRPATVVYAAKIRQTPKINKSNVVETLFPGTAVQVTADEGDWCAINYGSSRSGWVSRALLSVSSAASQPLAVSTTSADKVQVSKIASFVSSDEVNRYWQLRVNGLRQAKNLRQLRAAPELIQTATKWADYMGKINLATHVRPKGETAQQWIGGQGITFAQRNGPDCWTANYFSENIAVRLMVEPSLAGVKAALDSVLQSYLKEGAGGAHYRTLYSSDWNAFGAGYHPLKNNNDTYTIYFAFHYASLGS